MRSALYWLATNPAVLQKLREELDAIESEEPITYKQTQGLPYLKAVVRESLRMYPSIPAPLYRIVPAGGLSVDGHLISPGTVVGISSLAQNRDTAIFGKDAGVFNPDRWLGDESEARYMEAALFNFGGSGPRSCSGRDLALVSKTPVMFFSYTDFYRSSCTSSSLRWYRSSNSSSWIRHIHFQ